MDCFNRYAFGAEGKYKYDIGPNADVIYEVTLKDFVKVIILTSAMISRQSFVCVETVFFDDVPIYDT